MPVAAEGLALKLEPSAKLELLAANGADVAGVLDRRWLDVHPAVAAAVASALIRKKSHRESSVTPSLSTDHPIEARGEQRAPAAAKFFPVGRLHRGEAGIDSQPAQRLRLPTA